MNIIPHGNRLILKHIEEKQDIIQLIEQKDSRPVRYEVVSVPKEKTIDVNVGDTVIITKGTGSSFESEGNTYMIVRESDVLATICK